MKNEELQKRYMAAVESFVEKIKDNKSVIAYILMGSLSYDTVWEKSDVDSILVVRDQNLAGKSFCINEDNIPINVKIVLRSELKRSWDKSVTGSMGHSFITTSKIVYTTDDSLYEYLEDLKTVGKDDMVMASMVHAANIGYFIEKSTKWLTVKENPMYCQYWLLKGAESIAGMIICLNYEAPNREAVLRAKQINPKLMEKFYDVPMSKHMSVPELQDTIDEMEKYLESLIDIYSQPMLDFLSDGEIKTLSHIAKHFHTGSHDMFHFLDYLFDHGLVEKVSQTISITPKSRKIVEEMAFMRVVM